MSTAQAVVERLIGDREQFLRESRGGPFVKRRHVDPADLLTWDEVNRIICYTGAPRNLAKDGSRRFRVSVGEVAEAVADGATLQLEDVAPYSPRIAAIAGELSVFLGGQPVDANIYMSPSKKHFAFPPHFDEVDAFVVQISGYKQWQLFERGSRDQVVLDVVLEPGDVLFMRRKDPHRVMCAGDEPSLQLNLRILPTHAESFLRFVASAACSDGMPDATLPYPLSPHELDPDRIAWTRQLVASFQAWLSAQDPPELLDRFLNQRTCQVPGNVMALPDAVPGQAVVDAATPVALVNPQLPARVSGGHLYALGGKFRVPEDLAAMVQTIVVSPSRRWTANELAARHDVSVERVVEGLRQLVGASVLRVAPLG